MDTKLPVLFRLLSAAPTRFGSFQALGAQPLELLFEFG
jgi:hypothetical protein